MTAINDTYINALLADASYVDGLTKGLSPGDLADLLKGRMTLDLANYIGNKFEVLTQFGDSSLLEGFDATVWKDRITNQVYVSMRGTQEGFDFTGDLDLATSGVAYTQLADMVNWWMQETTSVGQLAKQIAVGLVGVGSLSVRSFIALPSVPGRGTLANVGPIHSVNGHSLGGYLASAFVRLFGAQIYGSQVSDSPLNTFNSAGFSRPMSANINYELNNIASTLKPYSYVDPNRAITIPCDLGKFPINMPEVT